MSTKILGSALLSIAITGAAHADTVPASNGVACNTDFYTNASGEIVHSPSLRTRNREEDRHLPRPEHLVLALPPGNVLTPRWRRPVALTNLSMTDLRLSAAALPRTLYEPPA